MNPDDPLLALLACPLDKGPLSLVAEEETAEAALYNPRLRLSYPIVDGIPQLLPSSGRKVGADDHERLLTRLKASAA
ncbi:Trm112 family protein [Streptomyces sp. rh34]|uniref:Trm112 family protein n=1 Tax=Streptomyces sp. rh34 TaxID=2034272 RepID=UPI000BF22B5A|nr:Trm112 family protein [Streptomyces sp. rh34]